MNGMVFLKVGKGDVCEEVNLLSSPENMGNSTHILRKIFKRKKHDMDFVINFSRDRIDKKLSLERSGKVYGEALWRLVNNAREELRFFLTNPSKEKYPKIEEYHSLFGHSDILSLVIKKGLTTYCLTQESESDKTLYWTHPLVNGLNSYPKFNFHIVNAIYPFNLVIGDDDSYLYQDSEGDFFVNFNSKEMVSMYKNYNDFLPKAPEAHLLRDYPNTFGVMSG